MLQTQRVHPFPFRTRKLSSAVAKILGGKPPGKIAQCQHKARYFVFQAEDEIFYFSRLGQMRDFFGFAKQNEVVKTSRKMSGFWRSQKHSSLAQSVERMTVNHDVAGSSPAGGATKSGSPSGGLLFLFLLLV